MGKSALPRINEITAYLEKFEPAMLKELQGDESAKGASLDSGVLGGDAEEVGEEELRQGLSAQAKVLETTLSSAIERSRVAVERINQRLLRARRYRFLGELLATIGASGVIGTALLDNRTATLIAGFLALGSSLFALFATKVVLGSDARETELVETARKLAKSSGSAELTQNLLKAIGAIRFDVDQMKALIQESNMLFAELNDALSAADL